MAYTSVIPVHRLDRSIEYVKDKEKTTQKADSLEAAIDYAMNRTKTEQAVFEDTIGCTNENAYADMVATKKRFHKMGGVEGVLEPVGGAGRGMYFGIGGGSRDISRPLSFWGKGESAV